MNRTIDLKNNKGRVVKEQILGDLQDVTETSEVYSVTVSKQKTEEDEKKKKTPIE